MACIFNRGAVVRALLEAGADTSRRNAAGELATKLAPVSLRIRIESHVSAAPDSTPESAPEPATSDFAPEPVATGDAGVPVQSV